jgi:site-specific DNA recombinase
MIQSARAIVYLRVSTEEQASEAYGLESQERACQELCDSRAWTVEEIFRDEGISGWADVERPEFQRMMRSVKKDPDVNLVFQD